MLIHPLWNKLALSVLLGVIWYQSTNVIISPPQVQMPSHWLLWWEAQQGASSLGKGQLSTAWPGPRGLLPAVLSSRRWQQREAGMERWLAHARPHRASVWWRSMPCWLAVCPCTDRTWVEWWCWRTTMSGHQEVSHRWAAAPRSS